MISADDYRYWSTADAAKLLGPPQLDQGDVRSIIKLAGLLPAGKRRVTPHGTGGRHVRVYNANELIKAFDAIAKMQNEVHGALED